jgi:hypothetical protein
VISSATPDGGGFAYATCHHIAITSTLGIELRRPPYDSAFRYFIQQMVVVVLCAAIRDWTIAQIPGGAEELDQLVCDGKTMRGSIQTTSSGSLTFIAHVSLYSAAMGVAISQACYATGENHERAVLKTLLGELDLQGLLIQADACGMPMCWSGCRYVELNPARAC